ncbi:MAG: hypothetical protein IPL26_21875 [Leptospiraceae bacterium]|nr:hypothetical protein [Leptospiraceae bacterium]
MEIKKDDSINNPPDYIREPTSKDGLYYFENGLMVFTEKFHLKRGFCCGNGCRHCPYFRSS